MRAGTPVPGGTSVSRHRLFPVLALTFIIPALSSGQAESDFYASPKTPAEFWRAARFEIRTGSYERAADRIKGFVMKQTKGLADTTLVQKLLEEELAQ